MTASHLPRRGVALGVVLLAGVLLVGATPAAAGGTPPALAGHVAGNGAPMPGPPGPSLQWMPFVMPSLWLGLLAGVLYLSYRSLSGTGPTDPAMDALDEAYARGEVSEAEYERRRARLES